MLEQVDLTKSLSKAEYQKRKDALNLKMYSIGHAVYESQTPVVVVFEGWGAAGKGTAIAELTARLDPRGFRVYPITTPLAREERFPWLYRFWLRTPARGEISIFHSSWYRRVLIDRLQETISKEEWTRAYQDIQEFERMLADDGVVIIKFWLHIGKQEQKRRIEKLSKHKATAWQVSDAERLQQKKHKAYAQAAEEMFARTEAEYAPWTIVAAADRRWTDVQVFETIISRLEPRVAPHEVPLPDEIERQLQTIGREDGLTLTTASPKPAAAANPEGEDDAQIRAKWPPGEVSASRIRASEARVNA
jgi:AMP-polyphosphate phosphotransferase